MESLGLELELLRIGGTVVTRGMALAATAALFALIMLWLLFSLWRSNRARAAQEAQNLHLAEARARDAEARMADLMKTQSELSGHLAALQSNVTEQQSAFAKQLDERLQNVTGRVAQSLTDTTKTTQESLGKLAERLAVIDTAQNNIQTLAQDVVGLQAILSDKQTRGAFGQSRMETIIRDGLPMGTFEFQTTLSNGKRPDCTIHMPNKQAALVVDAKFPLEAWNRMRDLEEPGDRVTAARQFSRDMDVHIKAIAERYLIPGETQDTAFLFVPSESIFAEIHENFENVVQSAHRHRVVIVSPSLLLLSVQVIQSVLKDARMREQAHLIQAEVAKFMTDLARLDDRIAKLKTHHDQTGKDIDQIITSTGKLTRHGARIESLEFGAQQVQASEKGEAGKPFLRAIEGGDG
ncbi:MAG: DNA recombination protein RmuC [Pseudomonadota bacterium]